MPRHLEEFAFCFRELQKEAEFVMFLPEITVACFGQLRCLVEFAYLGALWKNVLTRRYSIVARG